MIDASVELLKHHFAAFFTFKNWLYARDTDGRRARTLWQRTYGRLLLYAWGLMFALHDWLVNTQLTFKFEEPATFFELVTGRLKRYKALLPPGASLNDLSHDEQARYLWAIELCDFCDQYDENHC